MVLRDYAVVKKAVEVIRALPDIHRVEAAYRPRRQPLERAFTVEIGRDGTMVEERLSLPKGELGMACPAFEAHRLSNFNLGSLQAPALSGAAFLWIDEEDFVVLETPLDYLRAELLLRA
ncbi:MAG: hypothetical protein L6Q71_09455, partial [Planctomycetes bacterium]|nr:hypothetical protein [Planctomycetota bacterium]